MAPIHLLKPAKWNRKPPSRVNLKVGMGCSPLHYRRGSDMGTTPMLRWSTQACPKFDLAKLLPAFSPRLDTTTQLNTHATSVHPPDQTLDTSPMFVSEYDLSIFFEMHV